MSALYSWPARAEACCRTRGKLSRHTTCGPRVKVSFGYSGSRHIGFLIVGFYLVRTHDRGELLVALLPLLSVLLLLLVIPFPAYRYAYPSVVMVTLLERWHSPARLHAGIRSL